jgi:hypothetical protein
VTIHARIALDPISQKNCVTLFINATLCFCMVFRSKSDIMRRRQISSIIPFNGTINRPMLRDAVIATQSLYGRVLTMMLRMTL